MRRYETTFIVNPQADDAAIDRQVGAVTDLIKNDGGQILYENRIGTRRLAYPLAGLTQGFYASLIFEAEPAVLPRLERYYKLEEPYLRYLTIRYEGKIPAVEEAPIEDLILDDEEPLESKPSEEIPPAEVTDTKETGRVEPEAKIPAPEPSEESVPEPAEEPPVGERKPSLEQPDPADEEL